MYKLTNEDLALIAGGDPFDLPDFGLQLTRLLHPQSPQVQPGSKRVPGAAANMYLVPDPRSDAQFLFDGPKGFLLHSVAFTRDILEWGETRGGLPVKHAEMPADAKWYEANESPDGKAGYFRDTNGHSVVPTIYANGLMAEPGAAKRIAVTIPLYRSGYPLGRDFAKHAQRLAVTIEGETETGEIKKVSLRGPPVGIWRISSENKKNNDDRPYYVPVVTLVAKVGQPGGPSIDEWRYAEKLREGFKGGDLWPPEQPAVTSIESARRGPIAITSGRQPPSPPEPPTYSELEPPPIEFDDDCPL